MVFGVDAQPIGQSRDFRGESVNIYAPNTHAIMQSLNLYVYVTNNPMTWIDPDGLRRREKRLTTSPAGRIIRTFLDPSSDYMLFTTGTTTTVVSDRETAARLTTNATNDSRAAANRTSAWVGMLPLHDLLSIALTFFSFATSDDAPIVDPIGRTLSIQIGDRVYVTTTHYMIGNVLYTERSYLVINSAGRTVFNDVFMASIFSGID